MPLVIPYTFVAETVADASQVNADFAAIAAMFGQIKDADLSAAADIDGNKMSVTNGKQIPTGAIANGAVTDAKLASDAASPGSDTNRAVSGSHIKAVTAADLARFLPSASGTPKNGGIGFDKLDITVYEHTSGLSGVGTPNNFTITPSTNFPVASYACLGVFVSAFTINSGTPLYPVPVASNLATNWTGAVQINGTGNATVKVTFIFAKLVTSP
jgi:hypothetical protein